jgi:hypothetical protein
MNLSTIFFSELQFFYENGGNYMEFADMGTSMKVGELLNGTWKLLGTSVKEHKTSSIKTHLIILFLT